MSSENLEEIKTETPEVEPEEKFLNYEIRPHRTNSRYIEIPNREPIPSVYMDDRSRDPHNLDKLNERHRKLFDELRAIDGVVTLCVKPYEISLSKGDMFN